MKKKSKYFAVEFGRMKEFYVVLLKHPEGILFDDFERTFFLSVEEAIERDLLSIDKDLSDFDLIEIGIREVTKKGYKLPDVWSQKYLGTTKEEMFCGGFYLMGGQVLKLSESCDEKDHVCLISVCSGDYAD
jgi:hypothetical protein